MLLAADSEPISSLNIYSKQFSTARFVIHVASVNTYFIVCLFVFENNCTLCIYVCEIVALIIGFRCKLNHSASGCFHLPGCLNVSIDSAKYYTAVRYYRVCMYYNMILGA